MIARKPVVQHLTIQTHLHTQVNNAVLAHPYFVYPYYKVFMKNPVRLISPHGKALCLLKTQFAKKPKNPV